EAIKNFNDDTAVNVISNTFNETSVLGCHYCQITFNPIEKVVELYERLVKTEREKNALLEKLVNN
ncbi:MAG: transcriptional regulator, partial [Dysgonamonadaceae bacterium]|nr:transcriptional regulator [Dysgonamonadaceae bacterium]